MLIGIVVAAVVLLAAIGGIILVLNKGDETQPGSTITPTQPTSQPTDQPTEQPSGQPTDQPTDQQTQPPSGQSIDLGGGISLTPAEGYQVEKTEEGFARLSNGKQIFVGQTGKLDPSTNPGQFCDSFHHKVTEGNANPKYSEPKTVNINPKVKAATCQAVSTVSAGNGSGEVFVASLVSVRTDGVALIGTIFFTKGADTTQLNKDFSSMVNSMLERSDSRRLTGNTHGFRRASAKAGPIPIAAGAPIRNGFRRASAKAAANPHRGRARAGNQ